MASKKTQRIYEHGNPPKTLEGHPFYGMELDAQQQIFAEAIWNPENLIVFANACAGSGKTTIAVGVANMLVQYGLYDGIVYVISPVQEEKKEDEPDYKKMYEELLEQNKKTEAKVTKLQQDNIHKDSAPASAEAKQKEQEALTDLVRGFM